MTTVIVERGNKLKTFRKYNFMTQRELAEKLNINRTKLSRFENNKEPVPSNVWETFVELDKQFRFSVFLYFLKAPVKWLVEKFQIYLYNVKRFFKRVFNKIFNK